QSRALEQSKRRRPADTWQDAPFAINPRKRPRETCKGGAGSGSAQHRHPPAVASLERGGKRVRDFIEPSVDARPRMSQSSGSRRGVLVVSIDPKGPSARAGILVGDIVTAWNGKPIERVREIMRLLGPESVGNTVDLALIRGGAPTTLRIVIGERPVA